MIDKDKARKAGVKVVDAAELPGVRRAELLAQLRALLPGVINADGAVDVNALRAALGEEIAVDPYHRGYALNFAGKGLARSMADTATELELKVEAEQSKNFDHTANMLIRGDNLDALKLLRQNYEGKVKMIYIDPPYNTASEHFIYKDNFRLSDAELIEELGMREDTADYLQTMYGTRTHSGWLSFMYPRLKLARDLLRDDGVIFISIDDNEQANLKLLCDEIFGEENFVAALHVEMSITQGMKVAAAKKGKVVKNAEYVLLYAKNSAAEANFNPLYAAREWDDHFSIYYDRETNTRITLLEKVRMSIAASALTVKEKGKVTTAMFADLYAREPNFREFIHAHADNIYRDALCNRGFDLSGAQKQQLQAGEIVTVPTNERDYLIFRNQNGVVRQLLNLRMALGDSDDFIPQYGLRVIRGDLWRDYYKDMMNLGREGGVEYKNGKKPVRLILDMLKMMQGDDYPVLDFFAGSGTTGEAVMRMNAADGGRRQFILVQWDEAIDKKKSASVHKFCTDNGFAPVISSVTIARLDRAGEKIKAGLQTDNGGGKQRACITGEPCPDIGYKVFSLQQRPQVTAADNNQLRIADKRRSSADTLYNMLAASGKPLHTKVTTVQEGVLYSTDDAYYVLGACGRDEVDLGLEDERHIYIDGYADICFEDWLNMIGLDRENLTILF